MSKNKKERKIRAFSALFLRSHLRWSRRESNLDLKFRKLLFYPLNYGTGFSWQLTIGGLHVFLQVGNWQFFAK